VEAHLVRAQVGGELALVGRLGLALGRPNPVGSPPLENDEERHRRAAEWRWPARVRVHGHGLDHERARRVEARLAQLEAQVERGRARARACLGRGAQRGVPAGTREPHLGASLAGHVRLHAYPSHVVGEAREPIEVDVQPVTALKLRHGAIRGRVQRILGALGLLGARHGQRPRAGTPGDGGAQGGLLGAPRSV